ncbi:unnamed protein product [Microthlaspi erraticum]|uniref:RNase H type-1 domain-containing protein n=1 Tax=Microthlaspi erraticum TaxID=1685480 RepID=A0A6D2HHV8_9BRAS|nr:unnamed protein product [Microthlaspi erraticum]
MVGAWTRLVPRQRQQEFFGQSVLEWLYLNLGLEARAFGSSWATLFAISVWWGWKWRCGNVFGVVGKCRDRVKFLKELAKGWMKLNTDGASRGNPGLAAAGGVLQNAYGEWCGGFALNIGSCTAPLAELWGVYYGLYIAWERGVRRLEVEIDSELVVGFLQTGIGDAHPLSFLVRLCHGFITRDWIVRISHVYREANRLADGLANYAFTVPLGFHSLQLVPASVDSILQDDVIGYECPRNICIT